MNIYQLCAILILSATAASAVAQVGAGLGVGAGAKVGSNAGAGSAQGKAGAGVDVNANANANANANSQVQQSSDDLMREQRELRASARQREKQVTDDARRNAPSGNLGVSGSASSSTEGSVNRR